MQKEVNIVLPPEQAANEMAVRTRAARTAGVPFEDVTASVIIRRSIDARRYPVVFNLKVLLFIGEPNNPLLVSAPAYKDVHNAPPVLIVGAGPAGLFAALSLLEAGLKPVVLERGKDVRGRRRDIAALMKEHLVNPDSNYCFGEGGAGAYSDGKLYTRSTKRGNVRKVLEVLVQHGATPDILVDAHPHIGTNKLPGVIRAIRETILAHGGEVHFNMRVTDFILKGKKMGGLVTADGTRWEAQHVILATGHSARDIFRLLHTSGIVIEAKPFALGVRVEHPQELIDNIQYHCDLRGPYLPPASYSLVRQAGGRGVYSFCMCPGGIIAPCATEQEEVVTNGWSPSKRDHATANSGIVVELQMPDFREFEKEGPLAAMNFQASVEHTAWVVGGRRQTVPAQRLTDFLKGKTSSDLPKTSYQPGIVPVELGDVLPPVVHRSLQAGFAQFGNMMKGFVTADAIVHAPESRTSSPVRIPRDPETLQHVSMEGLYPCGEGAGYAGGIVSAAMDGMRCAERIGFEVCGSPARQ
ncbi:MAG: FAD-binding protein [Flavobacteriales bacterium]|nr:FAD-binding protein [Flavobacteriales bacterium]